MPALMVQKKGSDLVLTNKYGVYSKYELEKQLKEGHLTLEELANIYDLKKYQIVHILRSLKISHRNILGDTRIQDANITPSMHQTLLGTLLGDGYMRTDRMYSVGHGIHQLEYIYHIADRLCHYVSSIGDKDVPSVTKKSFELWTHSHENLIPYFHRFYPKGRAKKYITRAAIEGLSPEGLAYWYMDDGKYGDYGLSLCVGNISVEEGCVLISFLEDVFGLNVTFQTVDENKGYRVIYIKSESRSQFLNMIDPYVIPSMRYKMGDGDRPHISFSSEFIISLHKSLCMNAGRLVRYFGDEDISKQVRMTCSIEGFKERYIKRIRVKIKNGEQISKTSVRRAPSEHELKELLSQGLTDTEIASRYGFGRNKIASLRKKMGISKKPCRLTSDQEESLRTMVSQGSSLKEMMKRTGLSFYKIRKWVDSNTDKCHQRVMKERRLYSDLKELSFDPSVCSIDDYVFEKEHYSAEINAFLKTYEWLKSFGVFAKWCFTLRLKGILAGIQILNEPTSYSKMLGSDTMRYECLIQRGATISWAHPHLGGYMLMRSIDWMVHNTDKRLFIGYTDPKAGEIGTIYQACNFKYLGSGFGISCKYRHPTYHPGKEFCGHSLRRTGVLKWWCTQNGITMDESWFKSNGFKDLSRLPTEIKERWYAWAKQIIQESEVIPVEKKGKYALIRGRDRREQKYLEGQFTAKTYPYPKRGK